MSEIRHGITYDPGTELIHCHGTQDVEPYLEENARRREQTSRGDFRHKWQLPNIMVERFYFEYTGGAFKPMNNEFWTWVDKKIMSNPDLAFLKTGPENQYRIGWG